MQRVVLNDKIKKNLGPGNKMRKEAPIQKKIQMLLMRQDLQNSSNKISYSVDSNDDEKYE